jgi:hypothetical protein
MQISGYFGGWIILLAFIFLTAISFFKIRRSHKLIEFIYSWGFPFGAFVWEDLFVFSLYGVLTSAISLYLHQIRLGLLFASIFWMVRSAGETLYFFLQQFITPKHDPHNLHKHFEILNKIFGDISYQQSLIIMQVTFQTILMFSFVSIFLLFKNWNQLV